MKNMNKLQIISDLHLEIRSANHFHIILNQLTKNVKARNLALLGDIGDPHLVKNDYFLQILNKVSENYNNIFLIAGNREYYGEHSIIETNAAIEKICFNIHRKNVHFLNNSTFKLGNQLIVGTTLWSEMSKDAFPVIKKLCNDCYKIPTFTPELNNLLHQKSVDFLKRELKPGSIVLSHHAPLTSRIYDPRWTDNGIMSCFATDLTDLVKKSSVWAFGHTHFPCDFKIENTRVVSNPLGYSDIDICSVYI